MIKRIKNKYYSLINKYYLSKIKELEDDRKLGLISQLSYRLHTEKYREKIMDNLGKIRL